MANQKQQDDYIAAIHANVMAIGKALGVDLDDPESSRVALEEKGKRYHSPGGAGHATVYGTDEDRARLAKEAEQAQFAQADAHYVEEVGVEDDAESEDAGDEAEEGEGDGEEETEEAEGEKSETKSKSKQK